MTAQEMWELFRKQVRVPAEFDAWAFGDDPDTLAGLVLAGIKTATSSAYDLYDLESEPLPVIGEYSVILNSAEEAVCIIQSTKVSVVPFRDVDPGHAFREGEGDRSLSYWRKVHETFFTRELAAADLPFHEDIRVVCEEFRVVYPEKEKK